jgi:hypothetical protein
MERRYNRRSSRDYYYTPHPEEEENPPPYDYQPWEHEARERDRIREQRAEREAEGQKNNRTEKVEKKETMGSWFQRTMNSTQVQFAATALVSGAVVAGAILGYQHVRRTERVEDLKRSIPEVGRRDEVSLFS